MGRQSPEFYKKLAERIGFGRAASPYNTGAWQKLRKAHREGEPLCRICKAQGRTTAGAMVDHVIPADNAPDRFLDPTNLQTLCLDCHEQKTRIDAGAREARPIGADGNPVGGW